jgi:hypothetical protein
VFAPDCLACCSDQILVGHDHSSSAECRNHGAGERASETVSPSQYFASSTKRNVD